VSINQACTTTDRPENKKRKIGTESLWPQVHVKNRPAHFTALKNTTISQLMTTILPKSPTAKIKCSTLEPQDRKRVLSHREQNRRVNMTIGDFQP